MLLLAVLKFVQEGSTNVYEYQIINICTRWRRQRSKGARSFRGQNILEPGHPDAHFS